MPLRNYLGEIMYEEDLECGQERSVGWHPSWTESKREKELSRTTHCSLRPDRQHSVVRDLLLLLPLLPRPALTELVWNSEPKGPLPSSSCFGRVLDHNNRKSNQDVAIHQFTGPLHRCSHSRTKASSDSLTLAGSQLLGL